MKFHVARISFILSSQRRLTKIEENPIDLLEKQIVTRPKYTSRRKKQAPLIFDNFIYDSYDGSLILIKLGKEKEVKIPKHADQVGFYDESEIISPSVNVIWDRINQLIAIEHKTTVFSDYEYVFDSISKHFNNLLDPLGYIVVIEPLSKKEEFWNIIRNSVKIFQLSFTLHMPNLFGDTNRSISEVLKTVQSSYNAASVTNKLENPDGNLKIDENDDEINSQLDWIKQGGGSWESVTKQRETSRRKIKISSKAAFQGITIETTVDIEDYSDKEAVKILREIRKLIKSELEMEIRDNQR